MNGQFYKNIAIEFVNKYTSIGPEAAAAWVISAFPDLEDDLSVLKPYVSDEFKARGFVFPEDVEDAEQD